MPQPTLTILLCPGFMTDARLWEPMAGRLGRMGQVLHVDQTQDESITAIAERALRQVPEGFLLIGFSFGGYVAREICRLAQARVKGLILINSSARGDNEALLARNNRILNTVRAHGFKGLAPSALAASLHPDRENDPALIDRMTEMANRLGQEVFVRQLSLSRSDGLLHLQAIVCPSLVIWSRHDRLRSETEARELADGIPGARFQIIEDSGHMLPLEQPDLLCDQIEQWVTSQIPK